MFRTFTSSFLTLALIGVMIALPEYWLLPSIVVIFVNYIVTGEARKYSQGFNCLASCAFLLAAIVLAGIFALGRASNSASYLVVLKGLFVSYAIWLTYKQVRYKNRKNKDSFGLSIQADESAISRRGS